MAKHVLMVALVVTFLGETALAQVSTGTISGTAKDSTGAVLPGCQVVLLNEDTGISRTVQSDAVGRYTAPSLALGNYRVTASKEGFQTVVRSGIALTVGQEAVVDIALPVGAVTQTVEVAGEAPVIETTTATLSALVDEKAIRDLPLNGRSFDQLIALQSAAPQVRMRSNSITSGVAASYSVHGARDQANRFLLDGTEVIQAANQTDLPGGSLGLNMGVEAVREFSVMTGNYSASYGKRNGAIINIASRSGTNQMHGSVFEFLRNSDLDARNFFDKQIPPFRRNQFGAALGGPIKRDRTFFFGNYEGLRQSLGLSVVETVPNSIARQGLLPDPASPGNTIAVAPGVRPFLAAFPLANGQDFKDGTAEAIFSPTQLSSQDFYLGRIDHRISDKDSFFGRYNYTGADTHAGSDIIYWGNQAPSSMHVFTLAETRAYATTVNTIRAGFTRSILFANLVPTVPLDPSLVFLPGAQGLGAISFSLVATGNTSSGGGGALTSQGAALPSQWYAINHFQYGDEFFHQHGSHSLQLGVVAQRIQNNFYRPSSTYGSFQFTDLKSLLTGTPANFTAPGFSTFDPTKAFRQTYIGTYIQDDYRVSRNFTLNIGLRWEYLTPPTEASGGRISNYHTHIQNGFSVLDNTPTLGSPFYLGNKKNFAPRLGFAWDIFGDGKTAVRGGFGMFYDQIETEFKTVGTANFPYYGTLQVSKPPFPLGFSGATGTAPVPNPGGMNFGLSVPVRFQYGLSIQRQITTNTALTVGYVGAEGYHLTRLSDFNTTVPTFLPGGVRSYPTTALRLNPTLAGGNFVSTDATSAYHGLELEVSQRFNRGLRYKVSFTYSKSIDSSAGSSGTFASGTPAGTMVPDDLRRDRALSAFDVRRNLVANLTYDLPWQNSSSTAARWIGGWQMGGIVTVADGMPFTALTGFNRSNNKQNSVADRPNLLPGKSSNPVLGGPDKYFDTAVFALPQPGLYGDLGRNTLTSPGFANLDFTLIKVIPVGERFKVDFRAEFFNFLNRANFGLPSNTIFNSDGTVQGNAGRVKNTVTTSRQIQFGLKLLF